MPSAALLQKMADVVAGDPDAAHSLSAMSKNVRDGRPAVEPLPSTCALHRLLAGELDPVSIAVDSRGDVTLKGKPKRKTVRAVWEAGNVARDEQPPAPADADEVQSKQPKYEDDDEPGPTDPIEALRRRLASSKRTRKTSTTTMTKITKQQALDQEVGAVVKAAQIHYERGWTDLDPSAPLPPVQKAKATGEAVAPAILAARLSDAGRIGKSTTGGTAFGAVVADLRAKGRA